MSEITKFSPDLQRWLRSLPTKADRHRESNIAYANLKRIAQHWIRKSTGRQDLRCDESNTMRGIVPMSPADQARVDERAGLWNPWQFGSEPQRVAYGTAWQYFRCLRSGRTY